MNLANWNRKYFLGRMTWCLKIHCLIYISYITHFLSTLFNIVLSGIGLFTWTETERNTNKFKGNVIEVTAVKRSIRY